MNNLVPIVELCGKEFVCKHLTKLVVHFGMNLTLQGADQEAGLVGGADCVMIVTVSKSIG